MTPLAQLLEAALFSTARPLTAEELSTLDADATLADVRMALEQIREHYDFEQHGVELVELDMHVNDPEFAHAMVAKLDEYMKAAGST